MLGLGRDPFLKLFALLVAGLAWAWVQSQETDTEPVRVQLDVRFPERLVPVEPPPATASVSVTGPRALIRRARAERPRMVVDLTDEAAGTHEVALEAFPLEGMPSGLAVVDYSPATLSIRLEQRVRRTVRIEPVWVGEPAADHEVDGMTVSPTSVEVTGPRSVLDDLGRVPTVAVDVNGLEASREVPVELDLPRGVQTTNPWTGTGAVDVQSVLSTVTLDAPVVVLRNGDYVPVEDGQTLRVALQGPTKLLGQLDHDSVIVTVELPEDAGAPRYSATFQASRPPRLEVRLPNPDVLHVKGVPGPVVVVRR